jgi:hypothetical protein
LEDRKKKVIEVMEKNTISIFYEQLSEANIIWIFYIPDKKPSVGLNATGHIELIANPTYKTLVASNIS